MNPAKPARIGATAFALIMALALVAGPVVAQPLQAWRRDLDWSEQSRRLHVTSDARGFVFESEPLDDMTDDVLVGRFHLEEAEYQLELRNQSGEGSVQRIRVALSQVIEYRDSDADGVYDATDATLRSWNLDEAALPTLKDDPARDGSHRITATYPLESTQGQGSAGPNVQLRFYIHPEVQSFGGLVVPPTETKFDVLVHDWPYNATDSQLALGFQVESDVPTRVSGATLETEGEEYRLFFSWKSTATVDGSSQPVGLSVVPASQTVSGVYFSYARGARIVHDPTVGASHFEPSFIEPLVGVLSKGSLAVYLAGFLIAAAAVGTLTYLRTKRR